MFPIFWKRFKQVHADIVAVLKSSSLPILQSLYDLPPVDNSQSKSTRGRAVTVAKKPAAKTLGAQFKQQLTELMDTLNSTSPHFIRCMKPNDKKVGNLFAGRMVDQLRYAGLVEVLSHQKAWLSGPS